MTDNLDPATEKPSTAQNSVRGLSAFVITAVLLIVAGMMLIPLSKKPTTSGTPSAFTTGIGSKPPSSPR